MRFFLFPFIFQIILTILCTLPGTSFPSFDFMAFLSFDKFCHFLFFGTFTFLFAQAFAKQRFSKILFEFPNISALIYGISYGIGIEFIQGFIGRSRDIMDAIANSIGAILGYLIFRHLYKEVLKERIFE